MGLFRPATSVGRPKTAQPDRSAIRGRISGPIAVDDEFPLRSQGPEVAQAGGLEQLESNVEDLPSLRLVESPPGTVRADKMESTTPSGPSQASNNSGSPRQPRTVRSSTLRYSTISDGTEPDRPQRKKSTLKSTLGRLFKRKKKSSNESFNHDRIAEDEDPAQHEHNPSLSDQAFRMNGSKRSNSLPLTEFDRALRSHSVGPDDMLAITSTRNSLQVDPAWIRRRAASSNRILSGRVKDFDGQLIGLSPRPASTHGRDNTLLEEDPEDIGRAITSDSRTLRRRSRSMSQLENVAVTQPLVRKRSDEIRYWRSSYNPGILSPNSTINNDDTTVNIDEEVEIQPETPQHPPTPKTPPQPFNFGPMMGMKITQAASIEERIATLEVRNQKLEKLVSQLFQVVPGVHNYVPDTPDRRESAAQPAPYISVLSSATETSEDDTTPSSRYTLSRESNESFGDGNTFIGSLPPSSGMRPRPTSNSTVRGATSLPAMLGENAGQVTVDQFTAMKVLLESERDAREALEVRVTRLSHRLNLLSQTTYKLDTTNTPYSGTSAFTHDEDEPLTACDTESEVYKTPREEEGGHNFGAFGEELRVEDDDGSRRKAARTLSLSQLTLKRPRTQQSAVGFEL